MWIFFSILVSALVFKSEKFQNISWPVLWSFQWIETWQLWSYYPSPLSPVPRPRQLWLVLRSLSRCLASFCSQQSLELFILSEHDPSFPSGPLVFPAPQSLYRCHRIVYNAGIPGDYTVSWYLAWIPGILVVVLQRFPGRTRALTSTGPLKQVYLCVLFLSPSPPLPQGLMRKDIWKALVSGDASHIGQELDLQHVSFPHTPHLQSKPVSSSPGLLWVFSSLPMETILWLLLLLLCVPPASLLFFLGIQRANAWSLFSWFFIFFIFLFFAAPPSMAVCRVGESLLKVGQEANENRTGKLK